MKGKNVLPYVDNAPFRRVLSRPRVAVLFGLRSTLSKLYLVTGGAGFIGSSLVRRLLRDGHNVRVLDNQSRGRAGRLADVRDHVEFIAADVRDADAVLKAARGVDSLCHLASVNGTEWFYSKPEIVLEVGVKGIVNSIDACLKHDVPEFVLASSSEVYQTPPAVPTDEAAPLSVPDPLNPRFSYGGAKIISELMALNYGRRHLERVLVFRPHNVYGPDMGREHVIPQLVLRAGALAAEHPDGAIRFPIQGDGSQTRAFVHIDDFTDGLATVLKRARTSISTTSATTTKSPSGISRSADFQSHGPGIRNRPRRAAGRQPAKKAPRYPKTQRPSGTGPALHSATGWPAPSTGTWRAVKTSDRRQ